MKLYEKVNEENFGESNAVLFSKLISLYLPRSLRGYLCSRIQYSYKSHSIYDKIMEAAHIIVRWNTIITTYGCVLFHDYLLMPRNS